MRPQIADHMANNTEERELGRMLLQFRVTELQSLLAHLGKNKNGRKNELLARAEMLLKLKSPAINNKIRELHRTIQIQNMSIPPPVSATISNPNNVNNFTIPHQILGTESGRNMQASQYPMAMNSRGPVACPKPLIRTGTSLANSVLNVPLCPEVRFKMLTFYDCIFQVLQPHSLMSGPNRGAQYRMSFGLSLQHASDLSDSKYFCANNGESKLQFSTQLQLRFCLLDKTEEQDDNFPPGLKVLLNDRPVTLPALIPSNRPGVEAKRPSRPLNITPLAKLCPSVQNSLTIMWDSNLPSSKSYAVTVFLVKKLTADDLLIRLKDKGTMSSLHTIGLVHKIIKSEDDDCQISETSQQVSIICPLGKCRVKEPCRSIKCTHPQCFDAKSYLQMNEKKGSWSCPVCYKPAPFEDLVIDGYLLDVVNALPTNDVGTIEIQENGTWTPVGPKSSEPPNKKLKTQQVYETICLDDDICEQSPLSSFNYDKKPQINKPALSKTSTNDSQEKYECIDLTMSDSDSSDTDSEPIGRAKRRNNVNPIKDDDTPTPSSDPSTPSTPGCIVLDSPCPSPSRRASPEREILGGFDDEWRSVELSNFYRSSGLTNMHSSAQQNSSGSQPPHPQSGPLRANPGSGSHPPSMNFYGYPNVPAPIGRWENPATLMQFQNYVQQMQNNSSNHGGYYPF